MIQPDSSAPGQVIRVAQVITSVVLGGGGQVMSAFARNIDTSAFAMDIYCVLEGGDLVDYIRSLGFKVAIMPICRERGTLRYDARLWGRLAGHLRRGRYDVVHTHLFRADLVGAVAAAFAQCPVVVKTLHNMGTRKKAYHRAVDRILNRLVYKKIVCVSESQRVLNIGRDGIDPAKAVVIHNGVDPARFKPGQRNESLAARIGLIPGRPVIGTVGRLIEEKGHRLLIEAMPRIIEKFPDVQLLVVGDGPLRKELEHSASSRGCRLVVTGLRSDVPELLGAMDVFVFPSWSEAFGIAVVEAMAGGVPVACSAIPALLEIVSDGVNGLVFDSHDEAGLADRVCRLLGEPELRQALVSHGLVTARRRFSEAEMIRQYERMYSSLVDAGKKS